MNVILPRQKKKGKVTLQNRGLVEGHRAPLILPGMWRALQANPRVLATKRIQILLTVARLYPTLFNLFLQYGNHCDS